MGDVTHFLAALLLTYFTRRAIALAIGPRLSAVPVVVVSNLLSLATWALIAGAVKTYDSAFNPGAAHVYVAAQALWLLFDLGVERKLPFLK